MPGRGHLQGGIGTENRNRKLEPGTESGTGTVRTGFQDPSVLKMVRRVNFGTGSKFGTDVAKRYGEGSEVLLFFLEKEAGKRYGY